MRKAIVLTVVAVLAIAIAAPSAAAVSLGSGDYEATFDDHSNLYSNPAGAVGLLPEALGDTINIGDEQRTISQISTIKNLATNTFVFGPSAPTELAAVLYDLKVAAISPVFDPISGATILVVDFVAAGRNPLTTDVDLDSTGADGVYGTADDPKDPGDGLAITFGGVFEVYEDAAKNFTPDPGGVGWGETKIGGPGASAAAPLPQDPGNGPSAWVEGALGHVPGGAGADMYPTVTDGGLFLAATLIELDYLAHIGAINTTLVPFAAGTVMREIIDLQSGVGSGSAALNIVGGSAAAMFERGGFGFPLIDMSMIFDLDFAKITDPDLSTVAPVPFLSGDETITDTLNYTGDGQWQIDSQDPILFGTIPEPASMSLLGLSLLGLVGVKLRKKS